MAGRRAPKGGRFNLLLLSEDDHYLEDHGAHLVACETLAIALGHSAPAADAPPPRLKGRLRISARALFFEPDDELVPVVQFPYEHAASAEPVECGATSFCLVLIRYAFLYPDAPFVFHRASAAPVFELLHSALADVLPLLRRLVEIAHGPRPEEALEPIVAARVERFAFDSSWLDDVIAERVVAELRVQRLSPLVVSPGVLVLTDAAVYYQAMHAVESEPQQRWPIGDVRAVLRKRHLLRHTALEIELAPAERSRSRAAAAGADAPLEATERGARAAELAAPADGVSVAAACPSVLFAFGSEMERDAAATLLLGLRDGARARALGAADASRPTAPSVDFGAVEAASLEAAQRAWLCGALSSFDYLMAMNSLAGRSVHDLSQYPVLPWVLADYRSQSLNLADPAAFRDLSKPIGALNPARLEQFRERYRESADAAHEPPFMYGTHYSTAGFVLYYLVRQAPALMLRLQSGRFDDPQRLFHSVCATWDGVNSSTSDVKELIPEFYSGDGSFLLNAQQLPLGVRASGERVGDVRLPPWARSASHFVECCRAALESDFASGALHSWIELVFGHRQTGPSALEADNVFFHLTYEGALDLATVTDRYARRALELQVSEFGQTPRQLFTRPHPRRRWPASVPRPLGTPDATDADTDEEAPASGARDGGEGAAARQPAAQPGARGGIERVAAPQWGWNVGDAAQKWLPRWARPAQPPPPSPPAVRDPTSTRAGGLKNSNLDDSHVGAARAPLPRRSRLALAFELRCAAAPRALAVSADGAELHAADLRGRVSQYSLAASRFLFERAVSESPLTAIGCAAGAVWAGSSDCRLYCASGEAGVGAAGSLSVRAHEAAVSCLAPARRGGRGDGSRLATGAWDRTVKLWDCADGERIALLATLGEHDARVSALFAGCELVASGADDGSVLLWDTRCGDGQCRNLAPDIGPVVGLALVDDGRLVLSCCGALSDSEGWICGGGQHRLRLLSAADGRELASEPLPCAAECMLVLGSTVLVGLTDGGVRISSWSSAGVGGPFDIVRGSFAPVVAMASADAADAVSVVAADGTIRHYTFDGSVSLEPGGGGGA